MTDPMRRAAEPHAVGTASGNPNMASGEATQLRESGLEIQLDEHLAWLRDHLVEAFPDAGVVGFRGELTLEVPPELVPRVLTFCRDDEPVRCELLADLSAVHWPGGQRVEHASETTGWPAYEVGDETGRIEIDYICYSITHNHRFRVRTFLPDDEPEIVTVTDVYRSAEPMEREVYDFFGVAFHGHPNLKRILMPEDWEGHPQRKDYPLGGVEVQYKGASIPPPDERRY